MSELARTHGRDGVRGVAAGRCRRRSTRSWRSRGAERIDADLIKPGMLRVARRPAQLARLQRQVAEDRRWGLGEDDVRLLDGDETERRLHVAGAIGAEFIPHCARSHPAKLVTGLARAVERLGVTLYEDTTVRVDRAGGRPDRPRRCPRRDDPHLPGRVHPGLPTQRRALLPLNSAMIVTDPLRDRIWDEIGWEGCELLGDGAHAYMYAQRTADGRIALGGRGVPYRFGSRTDNWGGPSGHDQTAHPILHSMFPQTLGIGIDQAWCGVLGVRRDWVPAIGYHPAQRHRRRGRLCRQWRRGDQPGRPDAPRLVLGQPPS